MEVVLIDHEQINRQYGSFYLDSVNIVELFEKHKEYFRTREFRLGTKLTALDFFQELNNNRDIGNYVVNDELCVLYEFNNINVYHEFYLRDDGLVFEFRTKQEFIDIVKSIPIDYPTCLKIVTIPDGVDFYIDIDDCGCEFVVEKHRTWRIK